MKRTLFLISTLFTSLTILLLPIASVHADLIPCTDDCTFADFLGPDGLIGKIVHFLLFDLAAPLAAIAFAWAGVLLLTGGASESQRTKAHNIIWYAVIGLALALAAWLIVNTIFTTLTTITITQ